MKRVVILWVMLVSLATMGMTQNTFVPLDEEHPYWIDKSTNTTKGLTVFSPKSDIGYRSAIFRIAQWNGLFWTKLPDIEANNVFYGEENNLEIGSYQNNVVVAGSFYTQGESIKGIAQWNGQQWVELGGGINTSRLIHDAFSISGLVEFKDELFVCGDFNLANNVPVNNCIKLSKGVWTSIPVSAGTITEIQAVGDTLFVAGQFNLIDGVPCNNMALYANGKWEAVNNSFTNSILALGQFDNNLIAATASGFFTYTNGSWQRIGATMKVIEVESIVAHSGRLFSAGLFVQNDKDSLRLIAIDEDDISVYLRDDEIESTVSNKVMLQQFGGTLYLTGSFRRLKKREYKHVAAFRPGKSVVEGHVYLDNNANCVFDAGDVPKVNAIVSLNDGESYTSTDENGYYNLFIQNNKTSKIEIFPKFDEEALCNGSERTVVTNGSDSLLVEDFALKLNKMTPVRLSFTGYSGFKVKHGYAADYILDCSTIDTDKFPIQVTLSHDNRLSNFITNVAPKRKTENTIVWELEKNTTIRLSFVVTHTAIQMNEELQFNAVAKALNTEDLVRDELTQLVVSAYDPNDKQCDKIELTTSDVNLSYLVRFQNLGNDNARDIHIVDTIDSDIPIEYIQIRKNSHFEKYATSYKVRGHAIVWSFKDIELPPKATAGDKLSSGYIGYDCGLEDVLTVGQRFTNKAYIYFDFQPPVITNTTESVVMPSDMQPTGDNEEFVVYPNPATDVLQLQSVRMPIKQVSLYTSDAKIVEKIHPFNNMHASFNVGHLAPGVYFIRIDHNLGSVVKPVVVR